MSETPDTSAFARVVLSTAAEIEAAERQIREDIANAAIKGDHARVLEVIERWKHLPTVEVLLEQHENTT